MIVVFITFGVALVPCAAFAVAMAASRERGERLQALRHPVRVLTEVLRSNNE